MSMASNSLEIERKFLIKCPDKGFLDSICTQKINIVQTYLVGTDEFHSKRIRRKECGGKISYSKNEKSSLKNITRIEKQCEISETEYLELIKEADSERQSITKTRWRIPCGEHILEIDIFSFWKNQALCEIELNSEDESVELPDYINVIKEVSDDPDYFNSNLSRHVPPEI